MHAKLVSVVHRGLQGRIGRIHESAGKSKMLHLVERHGTADHRR